MEYKFSITLDPHAQSGKPSDPIEIGRINKNLQTITGMTISDISTVLGSPHSFTWCPAIFKGNRSNDSWAEQQVFAIDFDGGIDPNEVSRRFNEFGITPNILYTTFSDTSVKRKFRVLIFTDQNIKDVEIRNHIQNGLLHLFPEADSSCKDLARFFFGGLKSEVLNEVPVDLIKLFNAVSLVQNIGVINRSTDRNTTRLFLYEIYKDKRPVTSVDTYNLEPPKYLKNFKLNRIDFNKISDKVKIFNDFLNGVWLHHPQLFGLATSLHWFNGGIKLMQDTMDHFNSIGKTHYTHNNYKILKYVKSMQYNPQSLKNFSPYHEDHVHTNLITSTKDIKGFIGVPESQPKISLSEGRSLFKSRFNEVLDRNDNKIYILKVPTGIGKTELLTSLEKPVNLCFPNHNLIAEVSGRMKSPYVSTPNLPEFTNSSINRRINHLYNIGLYKKVHPYLKYIENESTGKYTDEDKSLSIDYRGSLESSMNTNSILLSTHQRSLITNLPHEMSIYDEDPLKSILEIKTMRTSDLFRMERNSELKDFKILLEYFINIPCGVLHSNPVFDMDPETLLGEISERDISSDVVGILSSLYFIKNKKNPDLISYITRKDLPKDKTIVILSATIPVNFYKRLYGDRVEVFDLSNVQQQGKIIQHTSKSYSRQCLRYAKKNISFSGDPIITFKEFSDSLNEGGLDIHFGKSEGVDYLKGQNINVVGTPHFNNMVYMLYGSVMGLTLNTMDNLMSNQTIDWRGYKFKFMTYDNPDLRDIQLSLIESELIQAVGRARTLITDAEVNLYSNLPLSISTEFRMD